MFTLIINGIRSHVKSNFLNRKKVSFHVSCNKWSSFILILLFVIFFFFSVKKRNITSEFISIFNVDPFSPLRMNLFRTNENLYRIIYKRFSILSYPYKHWERPFIWFMAIFQIFRTFSLLLLLFGLNRYTVIAV